MTMMDNSNVVALSIILPLYNEGSKIVKLIEQLDDVLKGIGYVYEIILVNDGSRDDTEERLVECSNINNRLRVVNYKQNRGKGYAIKKGFSASVGNYVVFMDGDLEVNPFNIGKYLKALKNYDIVIGSKRHPKSKVVAPVTRRFLSWAFNLLVKKITGLKLSDTQSGLKAVKRSSFKDIFRVLAVKRYAFDVELLAVANLYGLKIVEMPVEITLTSSYFNFKETVRMLVDLMAIKWRLLSGKYC